MASPDETDGKSAQHKRGQKHMIETMRCLMFARDNLPGDVYNEFVKTMTEIWKQWYASRNDSFVYVTMVSLSITFI